MGNSRLRRFTAAVAACIFLLVIAGGLVSSSDAALAIPDWPLAWGRLVPPLAGGLHYESVHRLLAGIVAILSIILAIWSRRKLAWLAVAAILAQAALGTLAAKLADPAPVIIAHACLAQLCFGLVVAVWVAQTRAYSASAHHGWKLAPVAAAAALFGQTVLGATVRHGSAAVLPHMIGAGAATILVIWAGFSVLMHHMDDPRLRRPAMILLSLTFSQVFLGMGAYMARIATADTPQPMPGMVWFTVAHVAVGSLAFGAAVVLAMMTRQTRTMKAEVAHGGMAVA